MPEHQTDHDLAARVTALRAHDPEFARAIPSSSVADAIAGCDGSLVGTIAAAMHGYADRPALARRAERLVHDPDTGRAILELLPEFEMFSYAEVWRRVVALAGAWAGGVEGGLRMGDFVAVVGFTGVDHATIDLACMYLGAVAVPLPTGSPAARLAPIVAETAPRILAADQDTIEVAVETVLRSASVERLVVFDHDARVDAHREALRAAADKLAGRAAVVSLADELRRGQTLPTVPARDDGDPDRLVGLIYTSGSTGTPKGAIYTASMITRMWRNGRGGMTNAGASPDTPLPTIVLHYMPMSHVNGRAWLISGLSSGGIGFFAARGDMSTLFDDIRLSRPTVLSLVPRICDMVHQRYLLEVDRVSRAATETGADTDAASAETTARDRIRDGMLGGRIVSALCGSAPLSAAMHTFMARVLGTRIVDCYGSTETTRAVVVDGRVRRPPVLDYRLVDVPELGYFGTDKPHPRGELRLKSVGMVPGYFRQPEVDARAFDADGYYRTGDVFAELAPDHLVYVDRTNNVVKLSQGEFVAISRLEALYATSPHIAQIHVYGSPEQAFLLAVVVPARGGSEPADDDTTRAGILDAMRELARDAGLAAYEIPHDVILEPEPFTVANGLLSGIGKPLRPALVARYGARLERLYADIAAGRAGRFAALRAAGPHAAPLDAVLAAVQVTLGHPASALRPDAGFAELGGDSLSAHTFATVLEQIFDVEVPVQLVLGPTATLARIAHHLGAAREPHPVRPTFASIHGRDAVEVRASELTPERFMDAGALRRPASRPSAAPAANVLLTGATGYLGAFLAVEWLRRMADTGGRLICPTRADDDAAARERVVRCLRAASADRPAWFDEVAARHLEVPAADVSAPRLGLDVSTWRRLAAETDRIVHAAALVNHVLPYGRLFGPNVVGTAELIELALTGPAKPFTFVSTIAAALEPDGSVLDETVDVRTAAPVRRLDGSDANGYATGKWAGEVLLRAAHERTGLPVTVFRPDMILAHRRLPGVVNLPDRFTRLILSVVATGMAPLSFHRLDADGRRRRAHYSGLPVDFTAAAIAALGADASDGFRTYHAVNANDDGVSLDEMVDWLIAAGHPIRRFADYEQWRMRFEAALRGLPEDRRRGSLLPLLPAYARPSEPRPAGAVPNARFTAALAALGGEPVPSITPDYLAKCVADLRGLGLL